MAGKIKKLYEDFKSFAFKGNVIDLAVGVMIGGAFNTIVTSVVGDLFMPLIGAVTGGADFSGLFISLDGKHYDSMAAAKAANASTLNYGAFIQSVFSFLVLALCVFLFVRLIQMIKKPETAKDPRKCPFCKTAIDDDATRCPNCTSFLENPEGAVIRNS